MQLESEDGVVQADGASAMPGRSQPVDRKLAPAALGETLEVVAERCLGVEAVGLGLRPAPVDGGFLRRLVQDRAIGIAAEGFLDCHVIVHQKVPGQIDHRQPIGAPDPRVGIDVDRYLRITHSGYSAAFLSDFAALELSL